MSKPPKADESLLKRINYEYPYYEDFVEPKGALKIDRACHACFYYAMLAFKARAFAGDIESQVIQYKVGEEIPLWREIRDVEIAQSVALIYGLRDPSEFLKFKKEAWTQGQMLGIVFPVDLFEVTPDKRVVN